MANDDQRPMRSAIDFYERHPISREIILARLQSSRGNLDGLSPEDLYPHDQDHYGGLAVNDRLAAVAGIGPRSGDGVDKGVEVVDFCAGLGGPSRYYAHTLGASRVTGIELTGSRVEGANALTRLVGLDDRVATLQGDVMAVPLGDACCDAVVSQEGFLHVPDKSRALAEAFRILRPGGRVALTDWIAHEPLSDADAKLMWEGMAVTRLYDLDAYQRLLQNAGFAVIHVEDLTAEWAPILQQRLAMFQAMRAETIAAGTPAGYDAFYESYVRFVRLISDARLGGVRLGGRKPG